MYIYIYIFCTHTNRCSFCLDGECLVLWTGDFLRLLRWFRGPLCCWQPGAACAAGSYGGAKLDSINVEKSTI